MNFGKRKPAPKTNPVPQSQVGSDDETAALPSRVILRRTLIGVAQAAALAFAIIALGVLYVTELRHDFAALDKRGAQASGTGVAAIRETGPEPGKPHQFPENYDPKAVRIGETEKSYNSRKLLESEVNYYSDGTRDVTNYDYDYLKRNTGIIVYHRDGTQTSDTISYRNW